MCDGGGGLLHGCTVVIIDDSHNPVQKKIPICTSILYVAFFSLILFTILAYFLTLFSLHSHLELELYDFN